MAPTLSGDLPKGQAPITASPAGPGLVRLELHPHDRREVVRAFVKALTGFAATGHLTSIRHGNLVDSAVALTEVADSPAVVEALTAFVCTADVEALVESLDLALVTVGVSA